MLLSPLFTNSPTKHPLSEIPLLYTPSKSEKQIKELVNDHEMNCAIEIIPIQIKSYQNTRYSSSNIRSAITKGQFLETKDLLGRYYKLEGQVVRGHERGRLLGFPTANIEPQKKLLVPGTGIFACVAQIDDNSHPATTSIGYNPTFEPAGKLTIESHISDSAGDLYGPKIGLIFVQKLRDEIKFHSEEELIEQMKLDICQSSFESVINSTLKSNKLYMLFKE